VLAKVKTKINNNKTPKKERFVSLDESLFTKPDDCASNENSVLL